MPEYDVLVVGGGPAGCSAALLLARCRRRVLVIDAGRPRNIASQGIHGFLTRDGIAPAEFLRLASGDAAKYGVEFRSGVVERISGANGSFAVSVSGGLTLTSRKLLLATGVVDRVPSLQGIESFYGKTVHHCPYCDAWEHKDKPIAAYGQGKAGALLAIKLKVWSDDVILCTDGPPRIPEPQQARLERHSIRVVSRHITSLEGSPPRLERIVFDDGSSAPTNALFFATGNVQRSDLIGVLGLTMSAKGKVKISRGQRCSAPGVFVCGDAADDSQFVVVAAAHGARAAVAINTDLFEEDLA